MRDEDLIARLKNPEDNLIERKPEGTNKAELRRTLVAFANSTPESQIALLFVGVHDKGSILGVKNVDSLQKTVREVCESDCYPPISYSAHGLKIEEHTVLAVAISFSTKKPHFAGQAFVRRGAESVTASAEAYEELILSRNDKCRYILSWRNQVITVICVQHVLGKTKQVSDQRQRKMSECKLVSCDAHVVRLTVLASGNVVSEPLSAVQILWDDERNRPMLVIRGS